MGEVILFEAVVVCLFMVVVHLLEAEFLVVVRIILESVLIATEPITLLTDVGSCMTNLSGLLELLTCLVLLDHLLSPTTHDSNTLDIFAFESLTLSKSEYDSLIQKMYSVFIAYMATLAHPGYFLFSEFISFILDH